MTPKLSRNLLLLFLSLFALPCLLRAQTPQLQHRYSFVSDASDSVGGANGSIVGPGGGGTAVTINNGLVLPGGGGNDFSGYVTLPSGLLTTTTNITIEVWATQNNANEWATIWDFANNTSQNFSLCPDPGRNNGQMMSAFVPANNEDDLFSDLTLPNGSPQYIVLTVNSTNLLATLYDNAASIGTLTLPNATFLPGNIGGTGGTTVNAIGNDIWGDPQFQGTVYELRIWNGIVPAHYIQVSSVVGPTNLVTSTVPTSQVLTPSSTNLVLTGTSQIGYSAAFAGAGTGLWNVGAFATNWVSSNPSVLQVNSNGIATAVAPGTATVSATLYGVTATSPTIFVAGTQTLLHRYSFVSDASDSVGGSAWNGTLVPANGGTNATIDHGLILPGGGGPGHSGYVTLPAGILTNTTSLTVECWATQTTENDWAELFSFNNGSPAYLAFIPAPPTGANNGNMVMADRVNNNESDADANVPFATGSEQYITETVNAYTLAADLYTNGQLVASETLPNYSFVPGTFGAGANGTTNNYLGQDPYPDAQFQGTIYELRIWNGVLPPAYVAAAAVAGPSEIITNIVPTALSISANTSMVGAGTQQATVSGDFDQVSGVTLTDAATNWVSSNPSVLSVNSSGLITANNGGTATVSAMVDGVSATSATITVAQTAPTFSVTPTPTNTTLAVNDSISFSASALGGSLSYQWLFNSTPLTGQTNTTLSLTNLQLSQSGTYTIRVSNGLGTTNDSITLNVLQAVLLHRYSFVSTATDSVGHANGTIVAPNGGTAATISGGLTLPGGGGGGYSGYLAFPQGILTNTTSLTIECWVTENTPNEWATIWDFANNGNQNFEMCPDPGRNLINLTVADDPNNDEVDANIGSGTYPANTEQYDAYTFTASSLAGNLYTNGYLGATATYPNSTYIPGTIGGANGTSQNWLGNDTYGDSQFQGTIYEFRIWDGAVSPLYLAVSAQAGPSVLVTNLTPTAVSVSVTNYSTMIEGATQPASVTANFTVASNIGATASVTNWSSSNTGVLTVNSNGLITATGTGTATISAILNGVTGTSSTITVQASPPVIIEQPETNYVLLQGATFNASVGAIGNTPFVYRWFLNSGTTPISTSSNPTLSIPDVQVANSGNYTVLVSNVDGTALSSNVSVTVIAPSTYDQAVMQYGPIAFWPLDETSGTTAYDVIGGYNGTYTNFPSLGVDSSISLGQPGPTGAGGSSTMFGNNNYSVQLADAIVDIPEGPFNITNAITVVAWVQLQSTPTFDGIVGHGDQSYRLSINPSGNPGGNDGSEPADATATNNFTDYNWHMVAYTYTGTPNQYNNGSLYVDGVLQANNTVGVTPPGDNLDVWIGGSPDYGTARLLPYANLSDVAIFNKSFTAAQVQGLYNGTYVLGPQTITITPAGKDVTLSWQAGTLLQSTNILGPWTTNSTAVSPYTVPATNKATFFKLLVTP